MTAATTERGSLAAPATLACWTCGKPAQREGHGYGACARHCMPTRDQRRGLATTDQDVPSRAPEPLQAAEAPAVVRSPEDIFQLVRPLMVGLEQEHLRVLVLDTKNQLVENVLLYVGTLNTTTVRMAELFKTAIRRNAASIVLVHNHPSGDPTPSPEDVRLTREAHEAGTLLDVAVLDHVVIGNDRRRYVSLRERGLYGAASSGTVGGVRESAAPDLLAAAEITLRTIDDTRRHENISQGQAEALDWCCEQLRAAIHAARNRTAA